MGYFFREVDFGQDSIYAEYCNLELETLYRWSKTSWSGTSGNYLLYITFNNKQLFVGKSETELETPDLKMVGRYKEERKLSTKGDFKKQINKYFNLDPDIRKDFNTPHITTREICSYMNWKINDDQIWDCIRN